MREEHLSSLLEQASLGDMEPEWRDKLEVLLARHPSIIQWTEKELGRCAVVKHHIYTTSDQPLYQPPYRVPYAQQEILYKEIQEMEDKGVIQPSVSPWSAPIVMVKKDGDLRICIDYRKLNDITKTDPYPIPLIHETLDRLGGAKYFSAIDLASGYWQIEMDPEAQQKTAFIVPGKGR